MHWEDEYFAERRARFSELSWHSASEEEWQSYLASRGCAQVEEARWIQSLCRRYYGYQLFAQADSGSWIHFFSNYLYIGELPFCFYYYRQNFTFLWIQEKEIGHKGYAVSIWLSLPMSLSWLSRTRQEYVYLCKLWYRQGLVTNQRKLEAMRALFGGYLPAASVLSLGCWQQPFISRLALVQRCAVAAPSRRCFASGNKVFFVGMSQAVRRMLRQASRSLKSKKKLLAELPAARVRKASWGRQSAFYLPLLSYARSQSVLGTTPKQTLSGKLRSFGKAGFA